MLSRADIEEYHTEDDEHQIDEFRFEVFLVECHCTDEEADNDTASSNHRHYAYHRVGLT